MAAVKFTLDPNNPPRLTPEQEARLDAMTEEEIEAIAASDPDNPPSTEEELARGVFARDVRLARKTLGLSQEAFAAAPRPSRRDTPQLGAGPVQPGSGCARSHPTRGGRSRARRARARDCRMTCSIAA